MPGPSSHEVRQRLNFLDAVGLEYLTLDRLASTLSGGEAQRIQLATSLGSRLVGALYVLDEPSIGLHTRDTARLIRILEELRDLGNTILVVEHDPDVLRAADHLLDLGPGAGEFGGKVLAEGVLAEIEANPNSLTGRYLSGKISIPVPTRRRAPGSERLVLRGAHANNLHGLDVEIPLGMLVAITGVSGSGKSTLVHQVLYRAVARALGQTDGGDPSGAFKSLTGAERLNDVVLVDQTPIGRTPRSNPITYIKGFDLIRELFAAQPEAKRLSLTPGHFSFNVPGGRCNTCEGDGTVTVEMQFLADVELPCEDCNGTRYQAQHPRGAVQGQEHSRSAADDGEGGAALLCRPDAPARKAGRARRSRSGLSAPGPVGHHALRRRSAARQAGRASGSGARSQCHGQALAGQPRALHPRRADHRPALRRRFQAAHRRSAS